MSKLKKYLGVILCLFILGTLCTAGVWAQSCESGQGENIYDETGQSETEESLSKAPSNSTPVSPDTKPEEISDSEDGENTIFGAADAGERITKYRHDDWLIEEPSGQNGVRESRLTLGGENVYCVEPEVFTSTNPYIPIAQTPAQYLGIDETTAKKLSLIVWFGTQTEGRAAEDWYAITQSLLWKVLGKQVWILTPTAPTKASLENYWSEILGDVDRFLTKPSMDGHTYDMKAGKTLELKDSSDVLRDMKVVSAEGVNAVISGDTLKITAGQNAPEKGVIYLEKALPEAAYRQNILFGDGSTGQKIARFGIEERLQAVVKLNIDHTTTYEFFKVGHMTWQQSSTAKDECLKGATLRLTDESGKTIDEWVTDDKAHIIQKLVVGKTYTLTEIKPAKGYATADPVIFAVKDTSDIQKIVMKDEPILFDISKKDMTNGEELPGASLKVTDKDGKVVDSWVSDTKPHRIEKLIVGETYTLTEVIPAPGYVTATEIKFTVQDTAKVQKVEMKDEITRIEIYKVDAGSGENIEDAVLEISDSSENVVERWQTTDSPFLIEHLTVGETYTLKEVEAPEGYEKAKNMAFVVADTHEIQKVVMKDIQKKTVKAVATGDDFNWLLLAAVAAGSMAVAAGIILKKIKFFNRK